MSEMKYSGVEWIGDIPKEWKTTRIKQLYSEIRETCSANDNYELLSVSEYYGVAPRKEKISSDDILVRADSLEGYKICQPNDIVMNIMLAWKRALGKSDYTGIVSPAYCIYRPFENVNSSYYHYLFRTDVYADLFKRYSTGIIESRLRLYPDKFLSLECQFPPLEQQQIIAAYLDKKCSQVDTLISNVETQIEKLKAYKQSLITEVVTKGLNPDVPMKDSGVDWIGEIPEHWQQTTIGRLCFVTKLAGFEYTKEMNGNITTEGEVPIVRAQNIKMGRFIEPENNFISLEISNKLARCALDKKCVLITFIGAGIGEVAVFDRPYRYHLAPNVAKIVIEDNMKPLIKEEFLMYFMMSSSGQEEVNKVRKATAQPSLSMQTIRSIAIVLPTNDEQSRIVSVLKEKCSRIDRLIAIKQEKIEKLNQYKKSLIYEYVTGKKEVS